jgi:hypothetical protein
MVSCIGVFILLRDHEPTEEDRALRRQRSRRYRNQSDISEFNYTSSSGTPAPAPTWKEKVGSFFGRGGQDTGENSPPANPGKAKRRGGGGWIQAGSSDEWDYETAQRGRSRNGATQGVRFASVTSTIPRSSEAMDPPFHPPHRNSTDDSSVRLDLNLPGPMNDSFASSPDPSQSTLSLGPSLPMPRRSSPEPLPESPSYATLNSTSTPVRTFQGGTRFIESL